MKRILYSIVILVLLVACAKEPIQVYDGDPVFKIHGTIGGDSVNIEAGVNGYMESYHDTLFNKSYVGCSFFSETSTSPIQFDLALNGMMSDQLVNGSFGNIEFGSLSTIYPLLLSDVAYNDLITYSEWVINGETFQNNAYLEGDGIYDVEFRFLSFSEEYVLRDKLFIGGEEQFEPEIEITEGQGGLFSFVAENVPSHVDSVVWVLNSGSNLELGFSAQTEFLLSTERYVIECNYYSNGVLVNYKSEMFGYESSIEIVSIQNLIDSISSESIYPASKGQMVIEKNNLQYVSLDGGASDFEVSNLSPFTDPVTSMELLKGDFSLEIVLYASPYDSLVIDLNGTIGLKLNP